MGFDMMISFKESFAIIWESDELHVIVVTEPRHTIVKQVQQMTPTTQ